MPLAGTGFVLETRAEHALAELARMTAPTARVERDGEWVSLAADRVVPGDLLLVQEGDVVVADGRLVEETQLSVDESALTGESQPVDKSTGGDVRVLAGTTVLSGRGHVVVERTGASTEFGRVGVLVSQTRSGATPLERVVRRLVVRLGALAGGFVIVVTGVELMHGSGWGAALLAGVSLAIATVPEEFPLVYTLYLALGARRLAREKVLMRRLAGVETLGSTTVVCSDKTGTLTLGRVALGALAPCDGRAWARDEPLAGPGPAAAAMVKAWTPRRVSSWRPRSCRASRCRSTRSTARSSMRRATSVSTSTRCTRASSCGTTRSTSTTSTSRTSGRTTAS